MQNPLEALELLGDLVTRWRFELQTHCLKGSCSAN